MNRMRSIRTDMAAELRRRQTGELPGVGCQEEELRGLKVFAVDIFSREGELRLGKPQGQYYTLSLPRWFDRGCESFEDAVYALAELIKRCLPGEHEQVLVAALGNPDITPDALGSLAAVSVRRSRRSLGPFVHSLSAAPACSAPRALNRLNRSRASARCSGLISSW